MYYVLDHLG